MVFTAFIVISCRSCEYVINYKAAVICSCAVISGCSEIPSAATNLCLQNRWR
jgi:hypothetical protein